MSVCLRCYTIHSTTALCDSITVRQLIKTFTDDKRTHIPLLYYTACQQPASWSRQIQSKLSEPIPLTSISVEFNHPHPTLPSKLLLQVFPVRFYKQITFLKYALHISFCFIRPAQKYTIKGTNYAVISALQLLLPIWSKYFPHHQILKHIQSLYFLPYVSKDIKKAGRIYFTLFFMLYLVARR